MLTRSYLFVPGDRPAMLSRAPTRGADALILDLEDAVAPARKEMAVQTVVDHLTDEHWLSPETWVRVNPGELGARELDQLRGHLSGIMIPKVESPGDVKEWLRRLQPIGLNDRVLVLIETAKAMRSVDDIASIDGVERLMIGEADLGADIGMAPDQSAWDSLRVELVLASAAAGLKPPIGPIDQDFSHPDNLEKETRRLHDLGFGARAIIHPSQIAPVHRGLTPTPEEVDKARRIVRTYELHSSAGDGVFTDDEGLMIDEALVKRARRILEAAGESGHRSTFEGL